MNDDEREYFEWLEQELADGTKHVLVLSKEYDIDEISNILGSFDIPHMFEEYEEELL